MLRNDVRAEFICEKPNPYYEGKLTDDDKRMIEGYDFLANEVLPSVLNNLISDTASFVECDVRPSDKVAVIASITDVVKEFIEVDRNRLIISMIEGYGEE